MGVLYRMVGDVSSVGVGRVDGRVDAVQPLRVLFDDVQDGAGRQHELKARDRARIVVNARQQGITYEVLLGHQERPEVLTRVVAQQPFVIDPHHAVTIDHVAEGRGGTDTREQVAADERSQVAATGVELHGGHGAGDVSRDQQGGDLHGTDCTRWSGMCQPMGPAEILKSFDHVG